MSYDNTLKYLVEQFPKDFAKWLLDTEIDEELTILKTELSIEPVRADGVFFMKIANKVLHLEFQTTPQSDPPIPERMIEYWIRLWRQYRLDVIQVVIFLKETNSELVYIEEFRNANTIHRYRVIRMWEMNPELFLDNVGLLPLATLAKSSQPNVLLAQIAEKIDTIESKAMQSNVSACVQLLAGINFEKSLIKAYFKEEIMKESVIYQSIKEEGKQEARIQEASLLVWIIKRHLGEISIDSETAIKNLSFSQLESLGKKFLDWKSEEDLAKWLSNLE